MKLSELKTNPTNPRTIKDDKFKKLVQSLKDFPEMMEKRPIVCVTDAGDGKLYPLGGNMRLKALQELKYKEIPDSWVMMADEWTQEQRREFIIKDNVSFGEFDWEELANDWDIETLENWGLGMPAEWREEESGSDNAGNADNAEQLTLADRFVVPPFSVLDARQGYWQRRKREWNNLIGDIGQARVIDGDSRVNANPTSWDNKEYKGGNIRSSEISLLDPVIAEISCLWFGVENGSVFDCFAGDTAFGYVSSFLGMNFTGIELRKEQTDFNNERVKSMKAKYICDDGRNVLHHIEENSQDLLFSCPPYYDLEVYSDLKEDASNQDTYEDFLGILDSAFSNSIKCLRDNRFAVIVCGDVRDKKGFYYNFPDDIKRIFLKNGMFLYNEMILVDPVGNLHLRAGAYMKYRKVGKTHQNILVFYKGNPKEIKHNYKVIDYASEDLESFGVD